MAIFVVLMPTPQASLAKKIEETYQDNFLKLSDTQYLVSAAGTAIELSKTLGIADPTNREMKPSGSAVVLAVASYYGRAPATTWEWLKAKLEASP